MKNETIKVITKGKPSIDALTEKKKEIFFAELLSAFLNYKNKKKDKDNNDGKNE